MNWNEEWDSQHKRYLGEYEYQETLPKLTGALRQLASVPEANRQDLVRLLQEEWGNSEEQIEYAPEEDILDYPREYDNHQNDWNYDPEEVPILNDDYYYPNDEAWLWEDNESSWRRGLVKQYPQTRLGSVSIQPSIRSKLNPKRLN